MHSNLKYLKGDKNYYKSNDQNSLLVGLNISKTKLYVKQNVQKLVPCGGMRPAYFFVQNAKKDMRGSGVRLAY